MELIYVAIFIFIVESTRNTLSYFLTKISDSYTIDTITDIQVEMAKETLRIKTSFLHPRNGFISELQPLLLDFLYSNSFTTLLDSYVKEWITHYPKMTKTLKNLWNSNS